MAHNSSLLYGNSDSADVGAASMFITKLMHASTAIHMQHLMVEGVGSFAAHMALGVYDSLRDATDGLAEAWMGCTGQMFKFSGGSFELAASGLAEVQKIYDYIENSRMAMGSESHIQNEIDGICTLLSSALYKLTRLS